MIPCLFGIVQHPCSRHTMCLRQGRWTYISFPNHGEPFTAMMVELFVRGIGNSNEGECMESITRRDVLKGAAVAAAAMGFAGVATACSPQGSGGSAAGSSASSGSASAAESSSSIASAASGGTAAATSSEGTGTGSVRVSEPGFNAGWGDTTIEDYGGSSFDDVVDGWFQYDWSYEREFAEGPAEGEPKHVTIIVSSPTVGGNGDTLAQTVADEIGDAAEVEVVYLRNLSISPLQQIGGEPPVSSITTQVDGMGTVIAALHRASVVIAVAPTYYNSIDARMMTMISRTWSPTWRNPNYEFGPKKRTGVLLTCTGAPADYLKTSVRAIFTMADLSIISPEYRAEVFSGCGTPDTCANTEEYLELARDVARWSIQ